MTDALQLLSHPDTPTLLAGVGGLLALGSVSDNPYNGSNSGSMVSLLKGMYGKLTGTLTTRDVAYATMAAVQCQITVTNVAASINSLLAAANTADATKCPVSALPEWATGAYLLPSSAQVNFATNASITLTTGTPGTGWPVAAGQAWPIQGKASLDLLRLVSAASQPVSFMILG
jgi:hypothetical protein